MALFSVAAFLPIPLLILGALYGGVWVVLALLYITTFTAIVDRIVTRITPALPGSEFPVADKLSTILALGHLLVLATTLRGLAGDHLSIAAKLCLFLAVGQFMGQVSNANAHEMIHRAHRGLRRLGTLVYITLLFGHHASAHPLVHHKWVATPNDPNSAPVNTSFWAFLPRAWIGSFRAGYAAEAKRSTVSGRASWQHPYVVYIGGAILLLLAVTVWQGIAGLLWYLVLAAYATMQLLLSDYVQHYGLRRRVDENGRFECVSAKHSWNASQLWSSAMMLNAPRHSDHHAHPAMPYPGLDLPEEGPLLPASLPVMATLALFPRRWRKVMNPLVARELAKR